MKVNVRKRIFIGLSALAIAAAVAIPIGIVYGIRSSAYSTATPSEVLISKQDALPDSYVFGTDLGEIKAPALDAEGYSVNPDDYEKGAIENKNSVVTTETKAGEKAASITFVYKPKSGVSGPTYKVTYPLNTKKGTLQNGFGTNNDGIVKEAKTIPYSTNKFVQVDATLELQKYTGYVLKKATAEEPNPKYLKEDNNSALTEAELAVLNAGKNFFGVYKYVLNTDQFETTAADGTTSVVTEGTLEATFKIVPLEITVPKEVEAKNVSLSYGESFTFPVPDQSAQKEHYVPVSIENGIEKPVSEILVKPDGSTTAPAKGQPVDPNMVGSYEPGTQFKVSYLYKLESSNYTGTTEYSYIYTYTIAAAVLANPNFAPTSTATVAYGTIDANVQQTVPPYSAKGFTVSVSDAFISQQSAIAPKGASLSPVVNTKVDWANVNNYNSGTKYTVIYKYTPKQHYSYSGAEITVSQEYEIVKRKVTAPAYDFRAANESSYAYGDDPTLLTAPTAEAGFTVSNAAVYYANNKQPAASDPSIAPEAVRVLSADSYFVSEWTATLDSDNYEPEQANGPTSYKIGIPFKVGKQPAVYTGVPTYSAESAEFKSSLPASFGSIKTLPEEAKNKGYEYGATTYEIQTRATDNSSPVAGQPAVVNDISKYGAGTVVKAIYTFVAKANYSGNPVTATKLFTITKKTIAPSAAFSGPDVSLTWGTPQPQPTVAPAAPEGYKPGEYTGASFTAIGKDGKPATTSQPVDWSQFQSYGADTIVKVTWTYRPDSANYQTTGGASLSDVNATQDFKILPASTAKPTGYAENPADYFIANDVIVYTTASTTGANPTHPFPSLSLTPATLGTGYIAKSVVSVKVSNDKGNNTPDVGTDVTDWNQANMFDSGSEFKAIYMYDADSNHTGLPIYYVVTYRKGSTQAAKPTGSDYVESPTGTIRPSATTVYLIDSPPPEASNANVPGLGKGYKGTWEANRVSKVPAGATKTPAAGTAFANWTDAKQYDPGTEFEAIYNYVADSANGYEGPGFKYIVTYKVTQKAVQPNQGQIDAAMGFVNVSFGSFNNLNDPFPPPPFAGFKGSVKSASVTYKSSFPSRDPYISPDVNTPVSPPYKDLPSYNAGTQISVTFDYTPDEGYAGTSFTGTKTYQIITNSVGTQFPEFTYDTDGPNDYSKSNNKVDDLYPTFDPKYLYWIKNESAWYKGTSVPGYYTANKGDTNLVKTNIDDVANSAVGDVVTIVYVFSFAPGPNVGNFTGERPPVNSADYYTRVHVEKTFKVVA